MRIVCPGCDAVYEVPAELVAGRPTVRCVQCDEEWQTASPEVAVLSHDDADVLLAPVPARTPPRTPVGTPAGADAVAELVRPTVAEQAAAPDIVAAAPAVAAPAPIADVASPVLSVARQPSAADLGEIMPRHRRALATVLSYILAMTGWACSLGLLLAVGWMVVEYRSRIMLVWPPSQRLFEWLGLA